MSNLVELGYFTSESFFQFVPTAEGLKRPAPSSDHTFKKIDILTQEEQEYTIDENDYPLNTVYEYLNNYYCLKYMDLAALAEETDPATKIVLGELPEEPYSYIKQLTIYDSPNALYCIASLDENNQIVRQQYKIGENGFLQFYSNKIFGVYPSAIVSEYINTGDALLEDYAVAATSGSIASLKRIEMTITTSDFEDSSLVLPSPELDLTVIFGQGKQEVSSDNKKRTFIDAITLIAQGIITSSVSGEIIQIDPPVTPPTPVVQDTFRLDKWVSGGIGPDGNYYTSSRRLCDINYYPISDFNLIKLEAYDARYPTYLEWGLQGYREDKSSSTAFEGSWTKIGENYDINEIHASDVFYVRFYLRYSDEDEIEEDHLSYAQAFLSKG